MKKVTYLLIAFAVLLVGTSATIATSSLKKTSKTITLKNTTTFDIDEIYLSPTDEAHWGEDILEPDEILKPGEEVDVEIDCATWDVKLVAQDKSTCEISDVKICASAKWNITANCGK